MLRFRTLFLHPDAPPAAPPLAPAPPAVSPAIQVNALTAQLIAQHGTVENALRHLVLQSATTDATIQAHERTILDLRGKIPGEGSVVLPKAEAETFAKLKALGTPEEITAKVKRAGELETTVSRTEAEKLARQVATAAGLDPDAFVDYALRVNLPMELRDTQVTEHGKTVTKKLPFVRKPGDDKAVFAPIADYVGGLAAHEQRALKATASSAPAPGIEYHRQAPTGQADPATSVVTSLREKYPTPSQLKKSPVTQGA